MTQSQIKGFLCETSPHSASRQRVLLRISSPQRRGGRRECAENCKITSDDLFSEHKAAPPPSQPPTVWNKRPIKKPSAAAPRPLATLCKPLLRQSPPRVCAE